MESCHPLYYSNSMLLLDITECVFFYLLLLPDAQCTVKQILRGHAPRHLMGGAVLILCATLLAIVGFAGREFAGAADVGVYSTMYACFLALWLLAMLGTFSFHLIMLRSPRAETRTRTKDPTQEVAESSPGAYHEGKRTELEGGESGVFELIGMARGSVCLCIGALWYDVTAARALLNLITEGDKPGAPRNRRSQTQFTLAQLNAFAS